MTTYWILLGLMFGGSGVLYEADRRSHPGLATLAATIIVGSLFVFMFVALGVI